MKNCSSQFPAASDIFGDIDETHKILVIVCASLSVLTLGLFVEEIFTISTKYRNHRERWIASWMLGLFPMFSAAALMTLLVPRSTILNDFIGSVYLSVSIYLFLTLLITYHGGESTMCEIHMTTTIPIKSPPLACCLCCKIPEMKVTKRRLTILKTLVLQVAFVRPLIIYIKSAMLYDSDNQENKALSAGSSLFIAILSSLSMLVAMYGLVMVKTISLRHVKKMKIRHKLAVLQLTLLSSIFQSSVFDSLSKYNIPACIPPLSSEILASRYDHMLLIMEMMLLSMYARWIYHASSPVDCKQEQMANEQTPILSSSVHNKMESP